MSNDPQSNDTELREKWLGELGANGKEEAVFEFDMLLRGLDRFFNLENLFLKDHEQVAARDFTDELGIVAQLLKRLALLSRSLIEDTDKNAYHFQRYIETELADDFLRDLMVKKSLSQETPRESLYLLFDCLTNMNTICDTLVARERVSYAVFKSVGELLRRELLRNRFFNPLTASNFSAAYDRVSNPIISRVVAGIRHATLQRRFSFVLLAFFRLLHYLRFINPRARDAGYLRSSLLVFSLVRSEARALLPYLEHRFKEDLFDAEGRLAPDAEGREVPEGLDPVAQKLVGELDAQAYQLEMELRKVSAEELGNMGSLHRTMQLRGVVENAHGILANFFQQAIVSLVRIFEPGVEGTAIFPQFESRRHQSRRLFEDVSAFQGIMAHFEERLETDFTTDPVVTASAYLKSLKRFLDYFKRETFLLLRYNDLKEFGEFFKIVHLLPITDLYKDEVRSEFVMRAKYFKIFVDTTLAQIRQRQDLAGEAIDQDRIANLLANFLPAPGNSAPASEASDGSATR